MQLPLSFAEENYLKAIYHLSRGGELGVSTNSISEYLKTKPASVSDMIQKLAHKDLLSYEKYRGVHITDPGKKSALAIIRKHRLWEVFLVEKLKFNWDQVHEIAEQLEHIKSPLLIKRLDEFLGYPRYDPHGDPIPSEDGQVKEKPKKVLSEMGLNESGFLLTVDNSNQLFLQYLDKIGITIGCKIKVLDRFEYDGSMEILVNGKKNHTISKEVSENLLLTQ